MSVRGTRKKGEVRGEVSHIVGAQRDPPSTASAEFGLAVGAEVAAAIGKLGLAADAAGGRVVLLLCLLTPRLSPDTTHLLFVALKLLVQCSERRGEKSKDCPLVVHHTFPNFLYLINFTLQSRPVRSSCLNILTFIKYQQKRTWRDF